jgi:SAM-dependent methyltransferase
MNVEPETCSAPAYSVSAAIYDLMVGRYAFEHWRENLERLELRYDLDLTCVADAACGTGLAAAYLAERGAEVFASDLSSHMLREAERTRTNGRVRFQRQDMRYLYPPHPVCLINCATDAMNHLLHESDVRRTLASFHAALLPGGYAIFDMNTAWQLREGSDTVPWEFEVCGRPMRWMSTWDEGRAISTLSITFLDENGHGEGLVEIHRERAYDADWITGELREAGFNHVYVLDAAGLGKASERTRRLQFIARR